MGGDSSQGGWVGIQSMGSGLEQLESDPASPFLIVQPGACLLTSLSLSCHICEVWELGVPGTEEALN